MVKKLKILLSTSLLVLSLLCLFTALTVKTTKAEGSFKMVDGASIRLTEDSSGIRYMAEVSDTTKEYYILIVPEDFLTSKGITNDFVTNLESEYPTQEFAKIACTPFDYLGKKVISASLINLKDANYKREFVGIAYYIDEGVYTYASFNEGKDIFANARNIAAVASAFLNKTDGTEATEGVAIAKAIIGKAFLADESSFGIKEDSIDLTVGAIKTLSLDFSFDLNIKYSSNNEEVATVDANGAVSAVQVGNAVITATIENTDYSDSCAVTVGEVPGNVWIDTNSPSAARGSVKYLEEFDGEYGVLSVESDADKFVPASLTAFGTENYSEYNAVKFKIKGTSGLRVIYGTSNASHFGFPAEFKFGNDTWTECIFTFDKLKSGNVGDLVYYESDGSFYFNTAGTLYIADATCVKLEDEKYSLFNFNVSDLLTGSNASVSMNNSVIEIATTESSFIWLLRGKMCEKEIFDYYETITFVVKADKPCNFKYYTEQYDLNGPNYLLPITATSEYQEITFSLKTLSDNYDAFNNSLMVYCCGNGDNKVYIKDIYLSQSPDKLSVFKIDETLLGSSGGTVHSSVTYDATEKAIKVTGQSAWGGRWMVASSKFAEAERLLDCYDSITFVVKNDSTATITLHPYAENYFDATWTKYDITINGQTDYVEYTFSAENFKTNITGYKDAFMTWVGDLPAEDSIYIKDIYLSK